MYYKLYFKIQFTLSSESIFLDKQKLIYKDSKYNIYWNKKSDKAKEFI